MQKKYGTGWMGGWMDVRARLRIAYSNQKVGKKLFNNFRLDYFKIEVNYENIINCIKW